ncbi:N(4)-(beta-N-acetylglucosaminyl)-L-asparaginase-like [Haliotis cracherodii]|uniref:N(4)-(beta-N-acetylglucosaminyl)-L-asparaginase- like n=1 Tax=Haliotis cracherodii TaxID=6455 RepID=UPI0039EB9533
MSKTIVVGTWAFSSKPVLTAGDKLACGGCSCVDAVKCGINVVEDDASYGDYLVGRGGPRNKDGYLEQDAAIMDGCNLDFGAVTGLQGVSKAISVATDVMNYSEHNMLTGGGTTAFAAQRGHDIDAQLMQAAPVSPSSGDDQARGNDTLGVIALSDGNICAGVTTSGKSNKCAGRVGDSALPGCGLYADNEGGAACCSGDGDEILKYCPSFHTVCLMKQGSSAQAACDQVIRDIRRRLGQKEMFEFAVIAVDMEGNVGAATSVTSYTDPKTGETYEGFPYTVYRGRDLGVQTRVQARVQAPGTST